MLISHLPLLIWASGVSPDVDLRDNMSVVGQHSRVPDAYKVYVMLPPHGREAARQPPQLDTDVKVTSGASTVVETA